jgi:hypothetical protein
MHNYCRRAKHFKLDDDYEVMDQFTGSSRRHGQDRWRHNKMWDRWDNKTKRFLRSKVGQNWDTVFSDYCHVARQQGAYTEDWLRERLNRWSAIEQNTVMIDGYPHEIANWRRSSQEFYPLSKGSLYVDPATKIVRLAKGLKVEPKPSRYPAPDKHLTIDGVEYWHRTITDRKAGAGQTEPAKHKVWYKVVKWKEQHTRMVPVHTRKEGGTGWYVKEYVREDYEIERHNITAVAHADIKRLKLHEKE